MMNNSVNPIRSGLKELDDVIGGFNPGEIVILVSTDPIVRTAFPLNIALKNALNNIPALILNSETSIEQTGKWTLFMSLAGHQEIPRSMPLYVEEIGDSSINELKEKIKRSKETLNIEIVVINSMNYAYQHLPDIEGQYIAGIRGYLNEMKALAKELKIVVILTARIINDLELPGEIAVGNNLADLLIGVERLVDEEKENNKRIITVNRNGKNITMLVVGFNREYFRFHDLDENLKPPTIRIGGSA